METNVKFWKAVQISLVKLKDYGELIAQSTGKAVLYAFLISLILGVLAGVRIGFDYFYQIDKGISELNQQITDFKFENSKLTVDSKAPIEFSSSESTIIIDAKNKIPEDEITTDKYGENFFILQGEKAFFCDNGKISNVLYSDIFKDAKSVTFDKALLIKFMGTIKYIALVFILFFLWVPMFAKYLFSALIVALLLLILNAILGAGYKFKKLFSLSIYAYTWFILIDAIKSITMVRSIGALDSFWTVIDKFSGFAYLVFAGIILYIIFNKNRVELLEATNNDLNAGVYEIPIDNKPEVLEKDSNEDN